MNRIAVTGESTKETVKTIARGMPGVSGVTVVTCLRAFYFCTQGCGRIERPAFPAPSVSRGRKFLQTSGAWRRGKADLCHLAATERTGRHIAQKMSFGAAK